MVTTNSPSSSKGLILLFGMPRSGTTWLGKIFDSHPDVLYCHEPDVEFKLEELPMIYTGESTPEIKQYLSEYTADLDNYCTLRTRGKLPIFPKSFLGNVSFNRLKLSIYRSRIQEKLGLPYSLWNPVKGDARQAGKTAWKSVLSAGLAGTVLDAVEDGRMIYIVRHPCGQIASILNGEKDQKFVGQAKGSESYHVFSMLLETKFAKEKGLTLEYLKSLEPIERLAWKWTLFNQKAITELNERSGRGLVIRYDDLCTAPSETTRQMFEFCGLDFDPQVRDFVEQSTSSSGHSKSYYSVFKDPTVSANRWRQDLSPEDIEKIRAVVSVSEAGQLFLEDFPGSE